MGLALGLLAAMAGLLAASETAAQAVREGLALCGGSVIPALFPFLVVSRLFVATGSAAAAAVLQQLRPGLCLGRGGGGLLRQSPGRGMALADPCVGRRADGFADPQHLVPGGADFAVCAAGSGLRFSGGRPGSGGGDAPRLRLRGVLSGADPAADGPDGAGAPSSTGTTGAYRRHPAALRHPGGLRAGGGTDGLGRRVRPLSDSGGAGGERTPHEGLSVGKGSAGGSIGGIGCSHKPLGAVKGCCFPLWRTKNGTRIRHERITKFLCRIRCSL